jgi:hypothetical protein
MSIDDAIPAMSDKDLDALHANAQRLITSGEGRRQMEANRVMPLIEGELDKRRANAPPPKPRKTAKTAKKAAKPAKAAKKTAKRAEAATT